MDQAEQQNHDASVSFSGSFSTVRLNPELKAVVDELGFEQMTPIQAASIPALLNRRDLIGQAKTGSGKTAAFALPILQMLLENGDDWDNKLPRAEAHRVAFLVLCPTRELSNQVAKEIRRMGRRIAGLQVLVACGGMPGRPQSDALRKGVHIVVGTPGRVLDHLERRNMDLYDLRTLVLDEADRMLDMGFEKEMDAIIAMTSTIRQTVLFSATFPPEIKQLSARFQKDPVVVQINATEEETPLIRQLACDVELDEKVDTLIRFLKSRPMNAAILFCNQKATTMQLETQLINQGFSVAALHGDLEQADRDRVLAFFRNGSRRILIATDVAARGLDIADLDLVINFDLPHSVDSYIHRIGRTGRAGRSGEALSLVSAHERMRLYDFAKHLGRPVETVKVEGSVTARAPGSNASMQTLKISGGRKEKVRPGDILGALTGEAGGFEGACIGKIEIHDHFSYVAVKSELAELAAEKLRAGKIKGRKFLIRIES